MSSDKIKKRISALAKLVDALQIATCLKPPTLRVPADERMAALNELTRYTRPLFDRLTAAVKEVAAVWPDVPAELIGADTATWTRTHIGRVKGGFVTVKQMPLDRKRLERYMAMAWGEIRRLEHTPPVPAASREGEAVTKRPLKPPSKDAIAAYRAVYVMGRTQVEVARQMHTYQAKISRWCDSTKAWLAAGNILPELEFGSNAQPETLDPAKLDMGKRQHSGQSLRRDGQKQADDGG